MLRECRFDLRALSVFPPKKSALHLASIFRLRPFAAVCSRIEFDDRLSHVQVLARELMVVFTVKSSIAQAGIDSGVARGFFQQRFPQNAIIAWPPCDSGSQDQMRGGVAADRQFGPEALAARLFAYARLVMFAGVTFFKAGGINGGAQRFIKESHRRRLVREVGRTKREKVL